jgi:hypothetical protein
MKKTLLAVVIVTVTAIFSAFTTIKTRDTWFQYTRTSNTSKLDPTAYTLVGNSTPTNPANILNVVAYICVDGQTEVYPDDYEIVEYRGKPTVDVLGSLQNDINSATSSPYSEITNRVMLK